ncbi:hypothetical protein AWC15_12060 [Mycobacterium lacus]|uniref:Uncharacterized protein n=1 Tax=Mycobacterium lacus TaxID=169765 RepID=A0A1X1YV00_9MYCO|nr:hypothetical protein AWC15_12060 [Mycobacterium lacus]BBX95088.1 hypothetical protein MLAC_03820 [Mycobacterium lacus]
MSDDANGAVSGCIDPDKAHCLINRCVIFPMWSTWVLAVSLVIHIISGVCAHLLAADDDAA